MAIFKHGDMWQALAHVDHFLVTTNSFLRRDGCLVMGRGMALQAVQRYPHLPQLFGEDVRQCCGHLGIYGVILGDSLTVEGVRGQAGQMVPILESRIGLFQVKTHFAEAAELRLIERSTKELYSLAIDRPKQRFALNFPGIGNGRLSAMQVIPYIQNLPDNVEVWTYQPLDSAVTSSQFSVVRNQRSSVPSHP